MYSFTKFYPHKSFFLWLLKSISAVAKFPMTELHSPCHSCIAKQERRRDFYKNITAEIHDSTGCNFIGCYCYARKGAPNFKRIKILHCKYFDSFEKADNENFKMTASTCTKTSQNLKKVTKLNF